MSSKPTTKPRRSLAVRLTLWYAAMFALAAALAFASIYVVIDAVLQQRMDEDLREDLAEMSALLSTGGLAALEKEVEAEILSDGPDKFFFRLIGADGRVLMARDAAAWPEIAPAGEVLARARSDAAPRLETLHAPERDRRARTIYGVAGGGHVLQIAESLEEKEEVLAVLMLGFALIFPLLIVVAALLGWLMARSALRGVVEVTNAAIEISGGDLSRRVPETGRGDEIDRLAVTFNGMLDRIQALIKGMREMTDNIAHDLRSPLARIRAVAEGALTTRMQNADYRSVAADTIEECDRLMHMINTMLDITETEAGMLNITVEPVDLSAVIDDACELFEPLAEDKNITLSCSAERGATVHGNRQFLQRMLANLIDNALKYTPRGGSVSVVLIRRPGMLELSVRDSGVGIAADEIEKIFGRFYRGDQSRSQPGSGLGLSLALAIARAHAGDIRVESTLGEGSRFTIVLPASGPSR